MALASNPLKRIEVALDEVDIPGTTPDINELLAAVRRLHQASGPPALLLANENDVESLRFVIRRLTLRSLASAATFEFDTTSLAVAVGNRVILPSPGPVLGPLIVVSTHLRFIDGDLKIHARAVPEPLAVYWGLRQAPRSNGLTLGIVAAGDDPSRLGRVKVAMLLDPGVAVWARPAGAMADTEHTSRYRPKEGEEVLLGFLHGSPEYPVILGSLHNGRVPAAELQNGEALLTFGRVRVRLDAKGLEIILGDQGVQLTGDALTLFSGKQKLVIGASGPRLESDREIHLKGSKVIASSSAATWELGG